MADVINPNLSLVEPEVGGSVNTWGNKLNQNFSILDDEVFARIKRVGDIFTGTVGFISGTAANPSIHFGDTNTGIFGGGNDTLSVSVAGSTNVTFTPSLVTVGTALQANATSVSTLTASGTVTAPRLNGATTLELQTGGTTKVTVDNAGNAGLGVVPSAWGSLVKAFQVGGTSSLQNFNNLSTSVGQNVYFDGSVERYLTTATATRYTQSLGQHSWATAPSGTAGAPITFSQAMTLTQGGNLLVGTTSDVGYKLDVSSGGALGTTVDVARFYADSGSTAESRIVFGTAANPINAAIGAVTTAANEGSLKFYTEGSGTLAERARITSGGYFKASNTGVYTGVSLAFHEFNSNSNGASVYGVSTGNQSDSAGFLSLRDQGVTNGFHYRAFNGSSEVYRVLANGNVQNTNNSYGAISDIKLKENITDATPKLDKLNKLRVVNYNLKSDEAKVKQIGLIAQEVEAIFPGLVESTPDTVEVTKTRTVEVPAVLDEEGNEVTPATTTEETYTEREPNGEVTKAVKYSVLVPMLLKAVQELSAQNAALTDRIAALEAK